MTSSEVYCFPDPNNIDSLIEAKKILASWNISLRSRKKGPQFSSKKIVREGKQNVSLLRSPGVAMFLEEQQTLRWKELGVGWGQGACRG